MKVTPIIELIFYKSYAELKAEAARLYLSFFWWILEPIIYMFTFYIVFEFVFHRGGPGYVPSLLCGLVVWKWFASSVQQAANSILAHMPLIQRVYVKKIVFPGATLVTNAIRFAFVFSILLFFVAVFCVPPGVVWLALPVVLIAQFLLNAACGTMAAVLVPFVPDLRMVIEKMLMMGFFLSGIFFDITQISKTYQDYFLLNPMLVLIEEYRNILLKGMWPNWNRLGIIILGATIICIISYAGMEKYDRQYPRVLMQ